MVRDDVIEVDGKVIEVLFNVIFKVELDNKYVVLCCIFGKMCMYYIRIVLGDRVKLEFMFYSLDKGWIIFRYK